jgi:hypothetical protein
MVALCLLAAQEGDDATLLAFVDAALEHAWRRGFDSAMIGLSVDRPWHHTIAQRHRAITYATRLFAVHWPDDGVTLPATPNLPRPESRCSRSERLAHQADPARLAACASEQVSRRYQ